MGTSAIYEYAAMAIEGSSMGASVLVTYIAVGPSAPPIMPIAWTERHQIQAAVPKESRKNAELCRRTESRLLGFAISGPKSVMAPMPRK